MTAMISWVRLLFCWAKWILGSKPSNSICTRSYGPELRSSVLLMIRVFRPACSKNMLGYMKPPVGARRSWLGSLGWAIFCWNMEGTRSCARLRCSGWSPGIGRSARTRFSRNSWKRLCTKCDTGRARRKLKGASVHGTSRLQDIKKLPRSGPGSRQERARYLSAICVTPEYRPHRSMSTPTGWFSVWTVYWKRTRISRMCVRRPDRISKKLSTIHTESNLFSNRNSPRQPNQSKLINPSHIGVQHFTGEILLTIQFHNNKNILQDKLD